MSLTKEDLQAIRELIREENEPIKADIAELKEGQKVIRDSQLIVELEQHPRIQAALDGLVAGQEKDEVQDKHIKALELKAEDHDLRLIALEYSAKAK